MAYLSQSQDGNCHEREVKTRLIHLFPKELLTKVAFNREIVNFFSARTCDRQHFGMSHGPVKTKRRKSQKKKKKSWYCCAHEAQSTLSVCLISVPLCILYLSGRFSEVRLYKLTVLLNVFTPVSFIVPWLFILFYVIVLFFLHTYPYKHVHMLFFKLPHSFVSHCCVLGWKSDYIQSYRSYLKATLCNFIPLNISWLHSLMWKRKRSVSHIDSTVQCRKVTQCRFNGRERGKASCVGLVFSSLAVCVHSNVLCFCGSCFKALSARFNDVTQAAVSVRSWGRGSVSSRLGAPRTQGTDPHSFTQSCVIRLVPKTGA